MPRYIDADALWTQMKEFHEKRAEEAIKNAPTVDVVEVVRCKDCKYRNGDYCHVFLDGYSAFIYDNDFCSFGERREDEEV